MSKIRVPGGIPADKNAPLYWEHTGLGVVANELGYVYKLKPNAYMKQTIAVNGVLNQATIKINYQTNRDGLLATATFKSPDFEEGQISLFGEASKTFIDTEGVADLGGGMTTSVTIRIMNKSTKDMFVALIDIQGNTSDEGKQGDMDAFMQHSIIYGLEENLPKLR